MTADRHPHLAPGARTIDIDTLADEVAWWSRQVARDPRISAEAKAEISHLFAAGLALARTAALPTNSHRGGVVAGECVYLVGENAAHTDRRVDPGITERLRRAAVMASAILIR